ncbi:hypothetical protein DSM107010_05810 [Chroococcidiopsis cubana SAG 39.79]|uniref:MotA/TolQ/ExbB proton channel domain-containing protein n=2 Tax=Chroococcidiopsis TaxID=54298 RepID=A0AB37URK7_9CYAN|nr:hypothetical protein C7B79_01830 [Chroococcidiopsis cubana CCALA 043]RUT14098.1 hypothetical protein DSM107010_05810 [Chroococcidiopsis cubana SAG 39.79]
MLLATFVMIVFAYIHQYIHQFSFNSRTSMFAKVKIGAIFGFALGTVGMAIVRSGTFKVICQLLHVSHEQLQTSVMIDLLMIPTLPVFLAVLATVTGLFGSILVGIAYTATFEG